MKSSSSCRDLLTLIEDIKSSEVVENRVQLLKELEEINLNDKSSVNSVANTWCRKHLKMTLMSFEDSQEEEHCIFFYQLLLDLLSYSACSYSVLARQPVSSDKGLMVNIENFIAEQLSLAKDLASEIKKIPSIGSELLKTALVALDAVTRLCRVYCDGVNWDIRNAKIEDENMRDSKVADIGDHAINITSCTVDKLCELGIVAAHDGGNLVTLLNMSWKGVVSLLQFGKGALAVKVNIPGVIMTLISLAIESLRCAVQNLSFLEKEQVCVAEAKRIFRLAKFYLITAVRIISHYQMQALSVYKEIALCVVMILTTRISLSKVEHLKSASEILGEIVEPTALHLLNSLLNSSQLKKEEKFQILDWLFCNDCDMNSAANVTSSNGFQNSLDAIFSVSSNAMKREKILDLGRVALFLHLLKIECADDVRLGIARKLGWLLVTFVDADIYSSILVLQTPTAYSSNENHKLTYQPMFCAVLHALKTFMITVSSSVAWYEVESFLVENLFHPHFLCWEIVTELWSFILRHAEPDMVNDIIDKLCSLLCLKSRESVLFPESALRKTARLICVLVTDGPQLMVDRVYSSIYDINKSQSLSSVHTALLMEGFPLNSLSEKNRSIAKQRIITQYFDFLEKFEDKALGQCDSGVYGAPVIALCAALQSLQVCLSDTEMKTLKFLVTVIRKYKTSADYAIKDNYGRLLGELLGIISNMKHLYSFDEMEGVILELQNLFISRPALSDKQLCLCKPNLACFMAGLGHMEMADSEDCARSLAAWELYHMILRERHWAFVHVAITSFGYFAARTSCNQLWRFVPQDAALSFDLKSGSETDEDRFMSKLKEFLEKELTCLTIDASPNQLAIFIKEGQMLKEILQNSVKLDSEVAFCDMMAIDDEKQPSKKRKFPDGIWRGVELLQSGLKIMFDGLSQWQHNQNESTEIHQKFLTHVSCLEDVIAHLVSLADSG